MVASRRVIKPRGLAESIFTRAIPNVRVNARDSFFFSLPPTEGRDERRKEEASRKSKLLPRPAVTSRRASAASGENAGNKKANVKSVYSLPRGGDGDGGGDGGSDGRG